MLVVDMPMPEHCECDAAIMSKYGPVCLIAKTGCAYPITYVRPKDCPIKDELVLCGKCYYKDEKRIMDENALWCRKHHMYVTADWFCADGDRK